MRKVVLLCVVPIFTVCGCNVQKGEQVSHSDVLQVSVPSEYTGVVALIRSLGGTRLSDVPLRLQYTLRNTSDKPVVLHDLENSVIPWIDGRGWNCVGGGLLGATSPVTLHPGGSVSRWVELTRGMPSKDNYFRVKVSGEGMGGSDIFGHSFVPSTLKFHIGYDDKIFTGKTGDAIAPVLATPWIEIEVEQAGKPR